MTLKQLVNQAENQKQSSWENIRKFALGYGFGGNYYLNPRKIKDQPTELLHESAIVEFTDRSQQNACDYGS